MVKIETAVVYCGDALEILPTLEADVIITDPVWPNCPDGLLPGWQDPQGLWNSAMAKLPSRLKRLLSVLRCDSDPRFLQCIDLPFFRTIQLPYVMPGYIGRVLGGDEIAYWFGSPVKSAPGRRVIPGRAPTAQPARRLANGHPCSRAQLHFDWLAWWASDEGEIVCDPFMGSGTTGVAAAKIGRPFVGIEIEPKYFDLACHRIEEAHSQKNLFNETTISHAGEIGQQVLV